MFAYTASALAHAQFLAENLVVEETRMADNVRASHGLMLTETLSFALAAHMPCATAKQIVADACRAASVEKRHLFEIVRERTNAPLDWKTPHAEANYLGGADTFVESMPAQIRKAPLSEM
jgi:3-carboxy-cis,cis-muconate cycloisomerase